MIIWVVFQSLNNELPSAQNLSNLTLQIAGVGTISIGIVLVLLLGEIDLSVGSVAGVGAAALAVLAVNHGRGGAASSLLIVLLIGVADRDRSRASSSPRSACPRSSSRWPETLASSACSCGCSFRGAPSTSPTPASSAGSPLKKLSDVVGWTVGGRSACRHTRVAAFIGQRRRAAVGLPTGEASGQSRPA